MTFMVFLIVVETSGFDKLVVTAGIIVDGLEDTPKDFGLADVKLLESNLLLLGDWMLVVVDNVDVLSFFSFSLNNIVVAVFGLSSFFKVVFNVEDSSGLDCIRVDLFTDLEWVNGISSLGK